MQEQSLHTGSALSTFTSSALHHTARALLTPRYIAYMAGGTLLALAIIAIAFEDSAANPEHSPVHSTVTDSETKGLDSKAPLAQPADQKTSSSFADDSTTHASTNTEVTFNGRNVVVPANGSTTQTVTGADGSQATIHASSNSSQSSTSSSLNVDVHSTSSDSVP